MVKTQRTKKYATPARRRRDSNAMPLYPSIYDSTVFYFNYSQTLGAVANVAFTPFYYYYTTQPFANATFVNLNQYFARFRVEKMTATWCFADTSLFPVVQVSCAAIHDSKNWALNYQAIDSQKNLITYNPNQTAMIRCIWRMDPSIINDTIFADMPAAVVNPPQNINGGILVQIQTSTTPTVTVGGAVTLNIKYKVRFMGRMGIYV